MDNFTAQNNNNNNMTFSVLHVVGSEITSPKWSAYGQHERQDILF